MLAQDTFAPQGNLGNREARKPRHFVLFILIRHVLSLSVFLFYENTRFLCTFATTLRRAGASASFRPRNNSREAAALSYRGFALSSYSTSAACNPNRTLSPPPVSSARSCFSFSNASLLCDSHPIFISHFPGPRPPRPPESVAHAVSTAPQGVRVRVDNRGTMRTRRHLALGGSSRLPCPCQHRT